MKYLVRMISLALAASLPITGATAQDSRTTSWNGVWIADGSAFALKLHQQGDRLHLEAIETLGFAWRNSVGVISGESANFIVEYQGARATIVVVKTPTGKAIARPKNCSPEFHVICALVQNQQAGFTKIPQTAQLD
jgi:hypothetical protein